MTISDERKEELREMVYEALDDVLGSFLDTYGNFDSIADDYELDDYEFENLSSMFDISVSVKDVPLND